MRDQVLHDLVDAALEGARSEPSYAFGVYCAFTRTDVRIGRVRPRSAASSRNLLHSSASCRGPAIAMGIQPSARSTSRSIAFLLKEGSRTGMGRAGLGPTAAEAIRV